MTQHDLRVRALTGDSFPVTSERGHWLLCCRLIRSHMAWITEGCYGWWRHKDVLKHYQGELLRLRRER